MPAIDSDAAAPAHHAAAGRHRHRNNDLLRRRPGHGSARRPQRRRPGAVPERMLLRVLPGGRQGPRRQVRAPHRDTRRTLTKCAAALLFACLTESCYVSLGCLQPRSPAQLHAPHPAPRRTARQPHQQQRPALRPGLLHRERNRPRQLACRRRRTLSAGAEEGRWRTSSTFRRHSMPPPPAGAALLRLLAHQAQVVVPPVHMYLSCNSLCIFLISHVHR